MSIVIYPNTKVFVVAPAATATGGPELLHQLVFHLRNDMGINAYMYYIPPNVPNPVHHEYKCYGNPYVREIDDRKENLLIVPEIVEGIKVLTRCFMIRKAVWWLSVDNFYLSIINSNYEAFLRRLLAKILRFSISADNFDVKKLICKESFKFKNRKYEKYHRIVSQVDFHLVQSYYAMQHLKEKGIPTTKLFYLSDYLNKEFLQEKVDLCLKDDIVVFNPKKGFHFTKKIIECAPDIRFVPLINMTRQEVIETLRRAKVYIDFGNHPGKDRIPREAAILGCCVITGKRGSAKYFEDVPIPEEYKFEDREENIPKIVSKIKDCLSNFKVRYKDFDSYRQVIRKEPEKFMDDLKKIFTKV